jgi:hypothetical protein
MDNETAHQQAEQFPPTLSRPGEQENKASMQFIHRVVEGWRADDAYPATPDPQNPRPGTDAVPAGTGSRRIARAPGFGMVDILEFFCRKATVERVIAPLHKELLDEYYAALQERRERKAAYITLQIAYYLIKPVIGDRIIGLVGFVSRMVSGRSRTKPDK